MLDIKDIYESRKKIRELYDHDTKYGDLVGALLGIREKNKCIESMDVRIQGEYKIAVDLAENTTDAQAQDVNNQIFSCLVSYVEQNIDKVGVSKQLFEKTIDSCPSEMIDSILVGNSLCIML